MARTLDRISPELQDFLEAQPVFFVATAPSGPEGHVNVSPKGLDTFRVLDPHTVAYLDLTGSGIETVSHLRQNGRITLMFCAFDGRPDIVRLSGRGEVLAPDDPAASGLVERLPVVPGARAVIHVALDRISSSCGYAVPLMDFVGNRDELTKWSSKKGAEGLVEYRAEKNATSIDGLPGLV